MATNETSLRSELAKQLREDGWQTVVTIAENNVGLPDLYAKAPGPGIPGLWLELKWLPKEPRTMDKGVALSALQHLWLKQHQRLGGYAFYGVGYPASGGRHWTFGIGWKLDDNVLVSPTLNDLRFFTKRAAGEKWKIAELLVRASKEY